MELKKKDIKRTSTHILKSNKKSSAVSSTVPNRKLCIKMFDYLTF